MAQKVNTKNQKLTETILLTDYLNNKKIKAIKYAKYLTTRSQDEWEDWLSKLQNTTLDETNSARIFELFEELAKSKTNLQKTTALFKVIKKDEKQSLKSVAKLVNKKDDSYKTAFACLDLLRRNKPWSLKYTELVAIAKTNRNTGVAFYKNIFNDIYDRFIPLNLEVVSENEAAAMVTFLCSISQNSLSKQALTLISLFINSYQGAREVAANNKTGKLVIAQFSQPSALEKVTNESNNGTSKGLESIANDLRVALRKINELASIAPEISPESQQISKIDWQKTIQEKENEIGKLASEIESLKSQLIVAKIDLQKAQTETDKWQKAAEYQTKQKEVATEQVQFNQREMLYQKLSQPSKNLKEVIVNYLENQPDNQEVKKIARFFDSLQIRILKLTGESLNQRIPEALYITKEGE